MVLKKVETKSELIKETPEKKSERIVKSLEESVGKELVKDYKDDVVVNPTIG